MLRKYLFLAGFSFLSVTVAQAETASGLVFPYFGNTSCAGTASGQLLILGVDGNGRTICKLASTATGTVDKIYSVSINGSCIYGAFSGMTAQEFCDNRFQ